MLFLFIQYQCSQISLFQDKTYAILSQGPLTLRNSCFEGNNFRGHAPVVVFEGPEVDVNNNFLSSTDDELLCDFISIFEDIAMSTFRCIYADAGECAAELESTFPPVPTLQPTRPPVTRATSPPSGGSRNGSNRISFSALIIVSLFFGSLLWA